MKLPITKSARQYGYIIWNSTNASDIDSLFGKKNEVHVHFNGFDIGIKSIDWRFHRVSIGYKFTRALPERAAFYQMEMKNGILEVSTVDEQ